METFKLVCLQIPAGNTVPWAELHLVFGLCFPLLLHIRDSLQRLQASVSTSAAAVPSSSLASGGRHCRCSNARIQELTYEARRAGGSSSLGRWFCVQQSHNLQLTSKS